jgi:hypothetical protein
MKRKHIIAIGLLTSVVGFVFLVYLFAWMIAPGSYSRAETYEFNISEDKLLQIIQEVKSENPEIDLIKQVKVPNGPTTVLKGGRKDGKDHWYTIYFYYPDM